MWESLIDQLLDPKNRGRLLGIISGLFFGVFAAVFGILKALFITTSIIVGYFIGKKVDEQGNFKNFIEKTINRDRD